MSDDPHSIHVALATDAAYLPWVATAVLSCLRATTERAVHVHLQHTADVTPEDLSRLRAMIESQGGHLHPHVLDPRELGELPAAVLAHGGAISCARFLLPDLLADIDRVIYLDADTLTVRSLDPLWSHPLDGTALAAVCNVIEPSMRARVLRLGVPDPRHYLNSGVLLMNLDWMRQQGIVSALLHYVHERGADLLWVDQDALNVVVSGNWVELHPQWNVQNSFWDWEPWASEVLGAEARAAATAAPCVLHFEGPRMCKPWHYLCDHPYVESYRAVLRSTPWGTQGLTGRTAATRVLRRLPRPWRRKGFVLSQQVRQAAGRVTAGPRRRRGA